MVSYSKLAGFTGLRCAYTVIPKTLTARDASGTEHAIHAHWNRRHTTKFNGVAYPIQKAAAAIFTDAGKKQTSDLINFYLANAKLIRDGMTKLGFSCIGGDNAPYIWVNTGRDSCEFFDLLLNQAQVVCTPGAGFGKPSRADPARPREGDDPPVPPVGLRAVGEGRELVGGVEGDELPPGVCDERDRYIYLLQAGLVLTCRLNFSTIQKRPSVKVLFGMHAHKHFTGLISSTNTFMLVGMFSLNWMNSSAVLPRAKTADLC